MVERACKRMMYLHRGETFFNECRLYKKNIKFRRHWEIIKVVGGINFQTIISYAQIYSLTLKTEYINFQIKVNGEFISIGQAL